MKDIKLLKEPAYVYDLLFIFFWQYNKDNIAEIFQMDDGEIALHAQAMAQFEPISDDLYVFFHALQHGRCFFSQEYHHRYSGLFSSVYNLQFVLKKLSDYPGVVEKMIKYYFYDMSDDEIKACAASNKLLFERIKCSSYSNTEKNRLYEFFIDPFPYIKQLQYELQQQEAKLALYYEKNYFHVLELYEHLSGGALLKQMGAMQTFEFSKADTDKLYVSFCLLNRHLLSYFWNSDEVFFVLGYDYTSAIERLKEKKVRLKPDELGASLSDANRVKMLNLMAEQGELTCKELEQHFHFSGSTAYHHLTTMIHHGLVKAKGKGKKVYYSINRPYFNAAIDFLRKYAEEETSSDL